MVELLPSAKRPLIFGHRGFSELAPENTLKAFDLCIEHHIPGIELDVHLSKDGYLVVIHDHDLDRLAGISYRVEDLTVSELKQLDVGSHMHPSFAGQRIPTLEEVFQRYAGAVYFDVELKVGGIKDTGIAKKTWDIITAFQMESSVLISSFNPFAIRYFNALSKGILPSAVIFCDSEEVPKVLRHGWGRHIARCSVLKPAQDLINEQLMYRFATKKDYPILAWTVNDYQTGKTLLSLGVDGIISNNPSLFMD